MTRDDIIRLALMGERSMKQRIEWAVDMEREACAVIAFNAETYLEAAAAIRARGQV